MKELIILLIALVSASILECSCDQLLYQNDCILKTSLKCSWDSVTSTCGKIISSNTNNSTTTTTTTTSITYCSLQTECASTEGCSLVNGDCIPFSGCSAYVKTTNQECQSISIQCVSDGKQCVDMSDCSSYTAQQSCVKNNQGVYCYWLESQCVQADTCDKLPTTLTSDSACRAQLINCTLKNGGGCQDSGTNCSDQEFENQCYWDANMVTECIWNETCKDKTCDNLSNSLTTDTQCQEILSTCTTKEGGGCEVRNLCSYYTIQAACVKSINNEDCFWNGSSCVTKICSNALQTLTTNQLCDDFVSGCITNGNGCVQNLSCASAVIESACISSNGIDCIWNGTCKNKTCANAPSTTLLCEQYLSECTNISTGGCQVKTCSNAPTTYTSNEECDTYLSNCITKQGGGCATLSTCNSINTEVACVKDISGNLCYWNVNVCQDRTCSNAPSSFTTYDDCQQYLSSCSVSKSGSGCVNLECSALYSSNYCLVNGCQWRDKCYKKECRLASNTLTTFADCNDYSTLCTLDNSGLGCMNIPYTCGGITTKEGCQLFDSLKCGWLNSKCINQICETAPLSYASNCDSYLSGCVMNNSATGCMVQLSNCSDRKQKLNCEYGNCVWHNNQCKIKSCLTAVLTIYNYTNCNAYLSGCISNNNNDGCIVLTACSSLSQLNCADSGCYYNGSQCLDKHCDNIKLTTHEECQAVLKTCTSDGTNCLSLQQNCSDYTQQACHFTSTKLCKWDNSYCRDFVCSDVSSPSNDETCIGYSKSCTFLSSSKGQVCTTRQDCNTYTQQQLCLYNSKGEQCYWNTVKNVCVLKECENIEYTTYSLCASVQCTLNQDNTHCSKILACNQYTTQEMCVRGGLCGWDRLSLKCTSDISCYTADSSYTTHQNCQDYLSSCTVYQSGGCIPLKQNCSSYLFEEQCFITTTGECSWVISECTDKSCSTADSTYNSYELCSQYLNGCTVSSSGSGCVTEGTCEQLTQNQCKPDRCFWNTTTLQCITRTCSNAILDTYNDTQCNGYLTGCTINVDQMCQNTTCEDYLYTTDAQCKGVMSSCTSNGSNCIARGLCEAANEIGCVTQSDGQECAWYGNQCLIKTCFTASVSLTTEIACNNYKKGCTTQLNGGCRPKLTCQYANVQAACTTDSSGNTCVWDNGTCRNTDCRDISGSTFAVCQKQGCTKGSNGKCAILTICSEYEIEDSCLIGTDSPCLWIEDACYPYKECSSIQWTTDTQCKKISDYCTTNGETCVPITTCSQTNTNGGCVTGTDGDCIQTITELGSDSLKCTPFTSCTDALYLTHEECQTASPKCTTDGINGCIELKKCSEYQLQISCRLDKGGPLVILDAIIETGYCSWSNGKCRNQICTDLTGATPDECQQQLNLCTSDGTSCLDKTNCNYYDTKEACNTSVGFDGQCFWEETVTDPYCRLLSCTDLTGTSATACNQQLSLCTYDGTKCINIDQCSNYKTQIACHQNGKDGICQWNDSSCSLMQSCNTADLTACKSASTKCYYNSTCNNYTCDTYYKSNGKCTYFTNFDSTSYTYCTLSNGTCSVANVTQLSNQDCYSTTAYQYTWNGNNCTLCTNVKIITNVTSYSLMILIYIMNI